MKKEKKMPKNKAGYILAVGGCLVLFTGGLPFLVAQDRIAPQVDQVLMIIAGMTTIAALTAFQRFVENSTSSSFVHISFNEVLVNQSLSEGFTAPNAIPVDGKRRTESWDLSLAQLVGSDNSLALAKLRMEPERELGHIAYNHQTDSSSCPLGVTGVAQDFVSRKILPPTWLGALKEITSFCNQAVHGTEVLEDIAASVVKVGGQLLEQLRRNNGGTS